MGAGIVGSSLAIGLARLGHEVTVVERSTLGPGPESFGIDVRSVAITPVSKEFLASLDPVSYTHLTLPTIYSV